MTQPGNLGNTIPASTDDLARKVRDLDRAIKSLAAARTIESTTIAEGGLAVTGDGQISVNGSGQITVSGDGQVVVGPETPTPLRLYVWDSTDPTQSTSHGTLVIDSVGVAEPGGLLRMDALDNHEAGLRAVDIEGPVVRDDGARPGIHMDASGVYLSAINTATGAAPGIGIYANEQTIDFSPVAGISIHGLDWSEVALVVGSAPELQVRSAVPNGAYIAVRAASFPTSSSRDVKQDIADIPFDSVEVIKSAVAQAWRYKPEFALDPVTHIGPMAEDLPEALVTESDGVKSVDLLSLVGALWDAVSKLADRVEALEAR